MHFPIIYHFLLFLFCFACAEGKTVRYSYGWGSIKSVEAVSAPLKRAQVFGERCSGSSFLEQLIKKNCKSVKLRYYYGLKHFPAWFDYPYDEAFYKRPLSDHTLEGSDDVIFFVIFRNPYDWIKSFHKTPHYAVREVANLGFSDFIRSPWIVREPERTCIPALELNPANRKPFKNVLKLRTARIKNMLMLENLVKYVYFINYETLKVHPQEVLEEVRQIFGIELSEKYVPIEDYKGNWLLGEFKEAQYPPISLNDERFINVNLNKKLEKSIGYQLLNSELN